MKKAILSSFSLLIMLSVMAVEIDSTQFAITPSRSSGFSSNMMAAYSLLKVKNTNSFVHEMEFNGFSLRKENQELVEGQALIDTLAFENVEEERWAFFRTVDLGYIRTINGFITFKDSDTESFIQELIASVNRGNVNITRSESGNEVVVVISDQNKYVVVDRRWTEPTYTEFNSLFTYKVTTFADGYIDISFEEVVPENVYISQSDVVGAVK